MTTFFLVKSNAAAVRLETTVLANAMLPVVMAGDVPFESLVELVDAYPELATQQNLRIYCALCTHLHQQGMECRLIDDINEFRNRYRNIFRRGDAMLTDAPSATDFGPYDVSEIAPSRVIGDKLVYYVENATYHLPYRVEAPWPARKDIAVNFLLLPLLE